MVRYIVMHLTDNEKDLVVVDDTSRKSVAKFIQRDFDNGETFNAEKEALKYAEYLNSRD